MLQRKERETETEGGGRHTERGRETGGGEKRKRAGGRPTAEPGQIGFRV
jgi:hypothetical protein